MAYYEWDDKFMTGIDEIDFQHQLLFIAMNNFMEEYSKGRVEWAIGPIIDFFTYNLKKHFSAEEKYMTDYFYPEYLYHRSFHEQLHESFIDLKNQIKVNGATSDLVKSLKRSTDNWFNHMVEFDKPFSEFLKTKINSGLSV